MKFFVEPFLRERLERRPLQPLKAKLVNDVSTPEGLRCFYKAELFQEGSTLCCRVISQQGSYQVGSMGEVNSWAILPENPAWFEANDEIEVMPFQFKGWRNRE